MIIETSNEFVKEVNKKTKLHKVLTWVYLIAGARCVYKAIQHANATGRYGIFADVLVDEYKKEDEEDEEKED